ncbi:hypothetical protein CXG81DRAFT_19698 [Caulochytrium protostelioides]|uniref:Dynein axonemal intermediate chain 4 n=1 Tax=Caulochytrium protostelioides TaxID=1555241 RepID=A0A4P9X5D5_9FUNG|nr:hypothetical protein CXG81DRAFT_19698 [Caulochytrium protostelioides]|eukprot:RKP00336.1 hypothetical protein CXG81DRAFT_19698 [Caulochytrium protostelioides]
MSASRNASGRHRTASRPKDSSPLDSHGTASFSASQFGKAGSQATGSRMSYASEGAPSSDSSDVDADSEADANWDDDLPVLAKTRPSKPINTAEPIHTRITLSETLVLLDLPSHWVHPDMDEYADAKQQQAGRTPLPADRIVHRTTQSFAYAVKTKEAQTIHTKMRSTEASASTSAIWDGMEQQRQLQASLHARAHDDALGMKRSVLDAHLAPSAGGGGGGAGGLAGPLASDIDSGLDPSLLSRSDLPSTLDSLASFTGAALHGSAFAPFASLQQSTLSQDRASGSRSSAFMTISQADYSASMIEGESSKRRAPNGGGASTSAVGDGGTGGGAGGAGRTATDLAGGGVGRGGTAGPGLGGADPRLALAALDVAALDDSFALMERAIVRNVYFQPLLTFHNVVDAALLERERYTVQREARGDVVMDLDAFMASSHRIDHGGVAPSMATGLAAAATAAAATGFAGATSTGPTPGAVLAAEAGHSRRELAMAPDAPALGDGEGDADPVFPILEPLWTFRCEMARGRPVHAMVWNPVAPDILAVAYGTCTHHPSVPGLVLCWSLKNVAWPERVFPLPSAATSLDFSQTYANHLAIGMASGLIQLVDVRTTDAPRLDNANSPGKHRDAVWALRWADMPTADASNKMQRLISVSTDGRVVDWRLKKGLDFQELMTLKRTMKQRPKMADAVTTTTVAAATAAATASPTMSPATAMAPSPSTARPGMGGSKETLMLARHAGGLAFESSDQDASVYLVGTEEGMIHKCSVSYTEQYLSTFYGHTGPVYRVQNSPFVPNCFVSGGADGSIRIWHTECDEAVLKLSVGRYAVMDVEWAPWSPTLLAAVTNDGRIEIWDLAHSTLDPVISHPVLERHFTACRFAPHVPSLLVGNSEGDVSVHRLVNLQRAPARGARLDSAVIDAGKETLQHLLAGKKWHAPAAAPTSSSTAASAATATVPAMATTTAYAATSAAGRH